MSRAAVATLAWCAPAVLFYALVLQRVSFDAPIWDDYDTILASVMAMRDAEGLRAWLAVVVEQHNEHRIAVMRLAGRLAAALGAIDFRALMFLGNLTVLGIFCLAWAEYRERLAAPIAGAAAFLLMQWSYYEATLMASAVLPNVGVVFFSLACIYFAARGGAGNTAACVLFGMLAAGSQANGLLALVFAGAAAAYARRMPRAAVLAAIAAILWALYFWSYVKPPGHPPLLAGVARPLDAVQLFLVIVGGVVPHLRGAMLMGALLVGAISWLTLRGAWRAHPTAGLWLAFLLASASAATLGRVGFGVFHAPRYAVYSSAILLVVFLATWALTGPWSRRSQLLVLLAAMVFSAAVSWSNIEEVAHRAFRGRLVVEVAGPRDQFPERYAGMQYPGPERARMVLAQSDAQGLYRPPKQQLRPATVVAATTVAPGARTVGEVNEVKVSGTRVSIDGWSDVTATQPGRVYTVYPSAGVVAAHYVHLPRDDVALRLGSRDLLFAGFRLEIDYATETAALAASRVLCVAVQSQSRGLTRVGRDKVDCVPR